ncbi:MAG: hypothetical protein ABS76_07650 [Pelagibacterium sp. SCN 64-44]|nr:MAG: hypothetical protein ABS76_07650 [Pelagibacterium sp. SCN 64-44]
MTGQEPGNKETAKAPVEVAIEPDLPIIDTHHHLWDRPGYRYLLPEMQRDIAGGHNLRGTVYVEGSGALFTNTRDCGVMYRATGDISRRSLGEAEFANGIGAIAASGAYGTTEIAAGIVGFVQMLEGAAVRGPLEAQMALSRFRGVRYHVGWHKDPRIKNPNLTAVVEGMLYDENIRAALREVSDLGLTFDAAIIFTQLLDFYDVAKANPNLTLILNHCGSPMASGPYEGKVQEVYDQWIKDLRPIAELPNVVAKIGGLGKPKNGLMPAEMDAALIAERWRPFIETTIELFGPERCMFETNFPVDGMFVPYTTVWNAFKHVTAACSADEKRAMYFDTANRIYRLGLSAEVPDLAPDFRPFP